MQERLPRGEVTLALAPCIPVINENVLQANRGRKCNSTAKGYLKNDSCLNEEKEKTGIRFYESATILPSGTRWRTAAASSSRCSNSSIATHRAAAAATAAALCAHKAVSYKEYFRQIFGLSGSKIFVESIPRKYYLGKMGSVLRFWNIFFRFWRRDVKAFRW